MSLFDFCYKKLVESFCKEDISDNLVLGLAFGLVLVLVFGFVNVNVLVLGPGLVLVNVLILVNVLVRADNKKLFFLFYTFGFLTLILAYFSLLNFLPLLYFGIAILVLTEFFFWTNKLKPSKKESTFWFTVKRKLCYLAESAFLLIEANGVYYAVKAGADLFGLNQETINAILCFVGWGTASIAIIVIVAFGWIKLNELKYKKIGGGCYAGRKAGCCAGLVAGLLAGKAAG